MIYTEYGTSPCEASQRLQMRLSRDLLLSTMMTDQCDKLHATHRNSNYRPAYCYCLDYLKGAQCIADRI
jgi:hypothetical protein